MIHPTDKKSDDSSWTYQPSFIENAVVKSFKFINKHIEWHKLPALLGTFVRETHLPMDHSVVTDLEQNLLAFRYELRAENLHDGYASKAAQGNAATDRMTDKRYLTTRSSDGRWNSLEMPRTGCAGVRFGRNIPRKNAEQPSEQELMTPNPRLVSEAFMKRTVEEFKPATTLNLLAAAWIQFQVHDWFFHPEVCVVDGRCWDEC